MANRYWVGGTGNWSDTSHWSTTSGGSSGAAVPTSSDDVFIDSNSGFGSGGTLSYSGLSESPMCHDFTSNTGHNYTIQYINGNFWLNCSGSIVLESSLTFNGVIGFLGTTSETLTTNGCDPTLGFSIEGSGTITLQDNLSLLTGGLILTNGTFDANDHNVTASSFYFYADTGYTPTVIMGSGTWEVTGNDVDCDDWVWSVIQYDSEVVTFYPETSTIKFTDNSSNLKSFGFYDDDGNEEGKTFNNLYFTGNGTGEFEVYGSNTFNDIKVDTPPHTIKVENGTTQTVSSFTISGSIGNLITIDSSNGTNQFTLSKSSGTVECDYLDISNSNATGGATWYAGSHSVDTNNNDGWIFTDAPSSSPTIQGISSVTGLSSITF